MIPPDVAAGLRFDPKDHSYWIEKRQVHGVSRVLELGELKPPFYGDASGAMALGTEVHKLTELMDHGEDKGYDFSEKAETYRAGWVAFRKAFPFTIVECEQPRYDATYDFAGTPDRIVVWRKVRTVVEIKTGQRYDWHRFQTALYRQLSESTKRLIVYLSPKHPYGFRAEEHKAYTDWRDCQLALARIEANRMEFQRAVSEPATPRRPWERSRA